MYETTRRVPNLLLSASVLLCVAVSPPAAMGEPAAAVAPSGAAAGAPGPAPAPSATAEQWITTEWLVRCDADAGETLDPSDCDDDAATGAAALTRSMLEEASPWLKDLGFEPPDVNFQQEGTRKYVAWISPSRVGGEEYGFYDGDKLFLNATYYFAVGSDERGVARNTPDTGTAVHEVFHAIQNRYVPDLLWSEDHEWIWEGTADAVMLMWLRETGVPMIPSTRYFDYPLHEPYLEVVDGEEVCNDCYATNRFWLWLGEELGSTDNVQYLHDFLQEDLGEAKGLKGLDEHVTQLTGEVVRNGLYDVYPQFIAESVWQSPFFSEEGWDPVEIRYTGSKVEEPRPGTVRPVAAVAHDLTITVPEGETAGLKIEFAEDHDDLHLVVGNERYDEPSRAVPDVSTDDWDRNVFRTALTGRSEPHEVSVRVVNVAENLAELEQRAYTLEITLEPLDPCEPEFMDEAVNYEHQLMPLQAGFFGSTEEMGFQTGKGTIEITGLVNDGGGACTSPLYGSVFGRERASSDDAEPYDEEKTERALQEMQRRVDEMAQKIFGKSMDEVTDEDLENMTPEQQRMMAEMMGLDRQRQRPTWREKPGDVVIPIYSPHSTTWKGGGLMPPLNTRHGGLAGWSPNAAALFNLHLTGTEAAELQEGGTYPAQAVASPDPIRTARERGVTVTRLAFYTAWEGNFVDDCGEIPAQFNAAIESLVRQIDPEGEALQTEDTTPGCLVSGSARILYAELSGEVTIEEITGAEVVGTFELSGPGTLLITDGQGDRQRSGSVTIRGGFSVPTERVPYESGR